MWAVVHEFAESAGYERLAKACKVSGGKGICHQDCVPRLFVACWDISMVAVARSGLDFHVQSHMSALKTDGLAKAPFDEVMGELEDSL